MINGSSNVNISWSDHNFTTAITYCVEINLGSTETVLLNPVCGLTGTQYIFSYPNHTVCDRFSFTVTPTEGERSGTPSQPVPGFFTQARGVYMSCQSCIATLSIDVTGTGEQITVNQGEDMSRKIIIFKTMVSAVVA